jgi:adenosylcobinamide-phosphate synthase
MNFFGYQLCVALALDLAIGDPRWLPHPVTFIGRWARLQERWWRAIPRVSPRAAGVGAWMAVIVVTVAIVELSIRLLPQSGIYWIFSFLALRSLDQHAMAVVEPLQHGRLTDARLAIGMMVGRDTAALDEHGVARALIETVAENTSDGVIAPLFWLCLGGPGAMAAYKAINTLDSMFGYKNERYLAFGWWSARADDWANWIPARLTAMLFWLIALLWPGMSGRDSVRVTIRDARHQPSPNSGYPEAAAAGALGVQLGGENRYAGAVSRKATLGDPIRLLDWQTYSPMRVLLFGASLCAAAMVLGVRGWQ